MAADSDARDLASMPGDRRVLVRLHLATIIATEDERARVIDRPARVIGADDLDLP